MTYRSARICCSLVLLSAFAARPAKATLIVAGPTDLPGTAIQDITLLPGTPFNPSGSAILIKDVSGVGTITINRDAQVGSTINIPTLAGGMYFGSDPNLGSYVFGNIAPLTGADFNGTITNVVQNPNDPGFATGQPSSFQSGNFSFSGASFGFLFLTGPAAGAKLFTDPTVPFRFSAAFNGLPPRSVTTLVNSGPDVLNVLFNGAVVATSSNRRIVLVPEPSSTLLLGTGALALLWLRRPSSRRTAGV